MESGGLAGVNGDPCGRIVTHLRPCPQPTQDADAAVAATAEGGMDLAETSRRVQESCAEAMRRVRECKDEASCSRAAVGLTLCMAQLLCKEEVRAGGRVHGCGRA